MERRLRLPAELQKLPSRPASLYLSLLSFLSKEALSLSASRVGYYVDTATGLVSAVSGEQLGNYFQKY